MVESLAGIRAVIFDIGATLVTGPPVAPNKVIAGLLGNMTAAEVASVIMTTPLRSVDETLSALEQSFGPIPEQAALGIAELWNAQAQAAIGIEGAVETVLRVKSSGVKIGLLSDIWTPYYLSVERAIPEVIAAADSIVLSFKTGYRKPDQCNFQQALMELAVEPGETVMVGDTYEHDILPAIELGMRAIWVLARPDREHNSIIRVLNGACSPPTLTVTSIAGAADVLGSPLSTLNSPLPQGA